MAEFATRGVANAGLATGIVGSALGVLNGGGGGLIGNLLGGRQVSGDDMPVTRYEVAQEQKIAELQAQLALRDANTYGDQKLLEVYKYFDGKIEVINQKLCEQAVWNATQTGTITCMAGQLTQLQALTKLVIPNGSVCPGWGNVTVTPAAATTT